MPASVSKTLTSRRIFSGGKVSPENIANRYRFLENSEFKKLSPEIIELILSYLDIKTIITLSKHEPRLLFFLKPYLLPAYQQVFFALKNCQLAKEMLQRKHINPTTKSLIAYRYPQLVGGEEDFWRQMLQPPNLVEQEQSDANPAIQVSQPKDEFLQHPERRLPSAKFFGPRGEIYHALLGTPLDDEATMVVIERLLLQPRILQEALILYGDLIRVSSKITTVFGADSVFNTNSQDVRQEISSLDDDNYQQLVIDINLCLLALPRKLFARMRENMDIRMLTPVLEQLLPRNIPAKKLQLYKTLHTLLARGNFEFEYILEQLIPNEYILLNLLKALPEGKLNDTLFFLIINHYTLWKQLVSSSQVVYSILKLMPTNSIPGFLSIIKNNFPNEWNRLFNSIITYAYICRIFAKQMQEPPQQLKDLYADIISPQQFQMIMSVVNRIFDVVEFEVRVLQNIRSIPDHAFRQFYIFAQTVVTTLGIFPAPQVLLDGPAPAPPAHPNGPAP